jgi:tetratricopeptide (TPR) repeat protein
MYRRALLVRGAASDGITQARLLNNLGALYADQRRFADAEALYREAIAAWSKASTKGSDDPDFAQCLYNYAGLLREQKRKDEAQTVQDQADEVASQSLARRGAHTVDLLQLRTNQ